MALYASISISYRSLSAFALSSRAARSSLDNALYRLLSKAKTSLEADPGCSARTSLRALPLEKKCHELRGFCARVVEENGRGCRPTNVRQRFAEINKN